MKNTHTAINSTIGPKDIFNQALGGSQMAVASAEYYFPMPGLEKDRSVRLSVFVDAGTTGDNDLKGFLRETTGVALSWFSPVGPLKISYGYPLNKKPDDQLQAFQFSVGTVF